MEAATDKPLETRIWIERNGWPNLLVVYVKVEDLLAYAQAFYRSWDESYESLDARARACVEQQMCEWANVVSVEF